MGQRTRRILAITMGTVLIVGLAEWSLRASPELVPDSWFWPTVETELKYRHLTMEGRDPDVVVMGSSFLEAAFDPRLIDPDVEVYNLAMPFSSFATMRVWLDEVVFESTNPQAILIGVPIWSGEGPESEISVALSKAIARTESADESVLRLWGLRGVLRNLDQSLARKRVTDAEFWTESGHQTAYREQEADRSTWHRKAPAILGRAERLALIQLIDRAKSRADVFILIEPTATSASPPKAMVDRHVSEIKEIASDTGIDVWEAPMMLFSADENYVDGIHFNGEGTTSFSQMVGAWLPTVLGRQ